jgi:DDE superfamily endonuclease
MQLDESEKADRQHDDEDDGESHGSLRLLYLASCYYFSTIASILAVYSWHRIAEQQQIHRQPRSPSMFDQRLAWDNFCSRHCRRADFDRHIRMSYDSFNKLLTFVRNDLQVNIKMAGLRGGAILPEICLYLCLRFLAGGSYSDIRFFTGVSVASFYRIVWKTIRAINKSESLSIKFPASVDEARDAALGFQSISQQGCIWNCVAVVDGYHLQIQTPSKKEARNVKSFFSGHYQTYGVNVQASCDHNCKFSFLGVAGPGVLGDREAINQIRLGKLVEELPGLYCAIGDCAYTPTEHLVPIFRGEHALSPRNDNFNFFASQLRIRIEMAFGLMVKKWGILARPLTIKLKNIKRLMIAIARLHNFCIDERLASTNVATGAMQQGAPVVYTPSNVTFDRHDIMLRDEAAFHQFEEIEQGYENPWSNNRDRMVREIEALRLTRPGNRRHRNS